MPLVQGHLKLPFHLGGTQYRLKGKKHVIKKQPQAETNDHLRDPLYQDWLQKIQIREKK